LANDSSQVIDDMPSNTSDSNDATVASTAIKVPLVVTRVNRDSVSTLTPVADEEDGNEPPMHLNQNLSPLICLEAHFINILLQLSAFNCIWNPNHYQFSGGSKQYSKRKN
jgi:hypothetical protein